MYSQLTSVWQSRKKQAYGYQYICPDIQWHHVKIKLIQMTWCHLDPLYFYMVPQTSDDDTDTAKLTSPWTLADKRWVGLVQLLCITMFDISKIKPKSVLGPLKAQKFSRCLDDNDISHLMQLCINSYQWVIWQLHRCQILPLLWPHNWQTCE